MFEKAIKREHYEFNLPAALEWAQVQHTKSTQSRMSYP